MNLLLVTTLDSENTIEGDIRLDVGQMSFVEGRDAIAQRARNRFRFFRAEWFLDTRLGFPYFTEVLVKNPDKALLEALFREVILGTDGVASITSFVFTIDFATRAGVLTWEALTDDGDILQEDYTELFLELI